MPKTPEMNKFLDDMAQEMFGRKRSGTQCVTCGAAVNVQTSFEDNLSVKEFRISGMCQGCQDEVFTEPKESDDD